MFECVLSVYKIIEKRYIIDYSYITNDQNRYKFASNCHKNNNKFDIILEAHF